MPTAEFQNGLSCGLLLAGVAFKQEGGGMPPGEINAYNGDCYIGEFGYGLATLFEDQYFSVLSSSCSYAPPSGLVCIGGWRLVDWDYPDTPMAACIQINVDGQIIYEGDVHEYFDYENLQQSQLRKMKTFRYKEGFSIAAKRVVPDTSPSLELFDIVIVQM